MKFQEAILNKRLIKNHKEVIDLIAIYLIKNKECKNIDIQIIDVDYMGFVLKNTENNKFFSFLIYESIIVYYDIKKSLLQLNKLNQESMTAALNEFLTL